MTPDIFRDHEDAPTESRRVVTNFKPGASEVRVAGVWSHRVFMAVETAELRRSGYEGVKTQAEWLYFEPQGARRFAALLIDMADEADRMAGASPDSGESLSTDDAPYAVAQYAVESALQDLIDEPEPLPVVHLHLRALPLPTAGVPDPPTSVFSFVVPSEHAQELAAAITDAAGR